MNNSSVTRHATNELQIQRGVGPALYGAAALGGSINVETSPFGETPHASLATGAGTFGTRRLVFEGDSGPLTGGWKLQRQMALARNDDFLYLADALIGPQPLAESERTEIRHSFQLPFAGVTVRSLNQIQVNFSESVTGVDAADLLINSIAATNVTFS